MSSKPLPDLRYQVETAGSPIIEGELVTFIWLGKRAPLLIGDFTDWESGQPVCLSRAAPGMWIHQQRFTADGYLEYVYLDGEQRVLDPYNPRRVYNNVSAYNNYFYMPAALPTPLLSSEYPATPRGTVTRFDAPARFLTAGSQRSVYLYQPPVAEPSPLLLVWDGRDYLRRAKLPTIIDQLIAQGRIQPLALAMVHNGGPARMVEYACSEVTVTFAKQVVLPLAQQQLNLLEIERHPGAFGVMGASMGGLMALFTGLRLPDIFGHVFSQSGAFTTWGRDPVIFDLLRHGAPLPLTLALQVGTYDFADLIPANRRLHSLLLEQDYLHAYFEFNGGHNYTAWRDNLQPGLEAIFGVSRP